MVKIFSYVIPRDYGFAPNPFYGFCTLATCKPDIRKAAVVGDWIVATGSNAKNIKLGNYIVYAMKVTEKLTFNEYWNDDRFNRKKPNLRSSRMVAFGDNIYHKPDGSNDWLQENSHHTLHSGAPNPHNIKKDTSADAVLISNDFIYWGISAVLIPQELLAGNGESLIKKGPSHRCHFSQEFKNNFVEWIGDAPFKGLLGLPRQFHEEAKIR